MLVASENLRLGRMFSNEAWDYEWSRLSPTKDYQQTLWCGRGGACGESQDNEEIVILDGSMSLPHIWRPSLETRRLHCYVSPWTSDTRISMTRHTQSTRLVTPSTPDSPNGKDQVRHVVIYSLSDLRLQPSKTQQSTKQLVTELVRL